MNLSRCLSAVLLGAILIWPASALASDPISDADLVALLNDKSSLSISDSVAMESYMREIRMWLMSRQDVSRDKSFVEAAKIVENRCADDVARIAELLHRLKNNERLGVSLEMDVSCAQRYLGAALQRKLGPDELTDLEQSDALIQHDLKTRAENKLPTLGFRQKHKQSQP